MWPVSVNKQLIAQCQYRPRGWAEKLSTRLRKKRPTCSSAIANSASQLSFFRYISQITIVIICWFQLGLYYTFVFCCGLVFTTCCGFVVTCTTNLQQITVSGVWVLMNACASACLVLVRRRLLLMSTPQQAYRVCCTRRSLRHWLAVIVFVLRLQLNFTGIGVVNGSLTAV